MVKHMYYTDGACSGNPGAGGYGVVELENNSIKYYYNESFENTTNNRMELFAILHVLKIAAANPEEGYLIYSDSAYAVNSINSWMRNWAKNGWRNSKKVTVENVDLMQEIYQYVDLDNYRLEKISGHCGVLGNELADAAATRNSAKKEKLIRDNKILIDI